MQSGQAGEEKGKIELNGYIDPEFCTAKVIFH